MTCFFTLSNAHIRHKPTCLSLSPVFVSSRLTCLLAVWAPWEARQQTSGSFPGIREQKAHLSAVHIWAQGQGADKWFGSSAGSPIRSSG